MALLKKAPSKVSLRSNAGGRSEANLSQHSRPGLGSKKNRSIDAGSSQGVKEYQTVGKRLIMAEMQKEEEKSIKAAGDYIDKSNLTPSSQGQIGKRFKSSPVKEDYIIQKTRMNLTRKWRDIVVNKDLEDIDKLQRILDSEREKIEMKR